MTAEWEGSTEISGDQATTLGQWLDSVLPLVDEDSTTEEDRLDRMTEAANVSKKIEEALELLHGRLPVFVYFSNYFRVHPRLHLRLLADRLEGKRP